MLTSPEIKLRGKILGVLDLQIEAAKAMLNGQTFVRRAMRWVDNPETVCGFIISISPNEPSLTS